ncbi:hypothetical protein [Gloeocapsa sp. PCC 73106]|uniref:hypothetical protein n=1 Tax=Gloeocapsa sp. PCC 73106 TaxID=102232 RepID=UPI0002AC0237|nr:hypothetical protein [Gloeocapsa sp. PCC 73106]ELR99985.1 hypothetical protein GLO73106DRAFT_00038390 [Gloeocapsa sp. PCC 73106]
MSQNKKTKVEVLLNSFQEILSEVTALEVRTIVVEEISLESFNPWQAYQEIYSISPASLEQQGIDLSVRDRYLELRRQLELELNDLNLTQLPSRPQDVLSNRRFLTKIRKLSIIKDILDQNPVYAQTLVELDGTITHRYTQKLLDHPQREQILAIHAQGVTGGEKQWGGMIGLIMKLIKSFQ